jgi:hypothetical protein
MVRQVGEGLRDHHVAGVFEHHAAGDLAAYWRSSTEELQRSRDRYEVTLRLEPRAAASLTAWRRTAPVAPGDGGAPAGWVPLKTWFEDEEQARFIVLGCGPRAEVLAPAALRAAAAADLAAALKRLRPSQPQRGPAGDRRAPPAARSLRP